MLIPVDVYYTPSLEVYPVTLNSGLSIKGQVKVQGRNLPCRVRLFHKASGRIVDNVKTSNDGNYAFSNLLATQYFVVAHHPASQFNAVIQDNVVPK